MKQDSHYTPPTLNRMKKRIVYHLGNKFLFDEKHGIHGEELLKIDRGPQNQKAEEIWHFRRIKILGD